MLAKCSAILGGTDGSTVISEVADFGLVTAGPLSARLGPFANDIGGPLRS
jgi:hypothetical protein